MSACCPMCDLPGFNHRPANPSDRLGWWWSIHAGKHPNFPAPKDAGK